MPEQPITVYLDSSDFSVLSEPSKHGVERVLSYLSDKVQAGEIKIYYSWVSVLEAVHTTTSVKPRAIERARIIESLCKKNCLLWSHTLFQVEAISCLRKDKPLCDGYARTEDGRWFPPIEFDGIDYLGELDRQLKEMLKENVTSRVQRRKIKSAIYKNGQLSPLALSIIEANASKSTEELRNNFPLPDRFFTENIFLQVMLRKLHPRVIPEAIMEALASPEVFIGWACDRHDNGRELIRRFRDGKLIEGLQSTRQELDDLADLLFQAGRNPTVINGHLRAKMSGGVDKTRTRILWFIFNNLKQEGQYKHLSEVTWSKELIDAAQFLPTLDTLLQHSFEYFITNAMAGPNRRKLRNSDEADLLHLAYLPHVDLFRCDGYMANIVKAVNGPYAHRVVGNLALLPDAIEALL